MILDIIAYIIIALAFGYTLYKGLAMFNLFGKPNHSSSVCSSCSSGACGSCSIKELAKEGKPVLPLKVLHEEIAKDKTLK